MPGVRNATDGDADAVVDTLTGAFLGDPFISWVLGDQVADLSRPVRWWRFWFEQALDRGDSAYVNDGCTAATIWVPPDTDELDEVGEDDLETLLDELLGGHAPTVLDKLTEMDDSHPDEPHWYLGTIGTHPAHLGRRLGSDLLAENLAMIDAGGDAVYLESTNPVNVGFYERFGFRTVGEIDVPGSSPVTTMWREAR